MRSLRDRRLWAAVAAAPPVWLALFLAVHPPLATDWPLGSPWLFAHLVLVTPVLEEIVFRGLIQGWLSRHITARWGVVSAANLVTSLLFMALHLPRHPSVWAVAVFGPSLVFGYFRERHGSLASPIALHMFYNAGFFLVFAPLSVPTP